MTPTRSQNPPDSPPSPSQPPASLADRLRSVCVGTRRDLHVVRHVFRGEPTYVVRDPITMESHRLDTGDYAVFVAIERTRPLGQIFEDLVASEVLHSEDEERFYRFVFRLRQLSFLNLPLSDEKVLYQRHVSRKRALRRQKLVGILFTQIPVINPDAFLKRTISFARPFFSAWALAVWVCLVSVAGFIVVNNFHQLIQPIQGVLLPHNLAMLWITLIVLKLFHEFGHAYACKHYGGYVPEMGIYLILFTPCAYVDASACWGFSKKRERLIVCLGGMYIESFIAALAVLVWAMTGPGVMHDLAYNVIFLASIVTVLFNINPLMRFDGYYVLSDLLEIPNLRQRATRYVANITKRIFLSIRTSPPAGGVRLRALLLGFGIAASMYRVAITVGISTVIAIKFPGLGLALAGILLGAFIIGTLWRLTKYLWHAEETAPVRVRAVFASVVVLVGVPTLTMFIPVPTAAYADGVVRRTNERVVRARVDGFLRAMPVRQGQSVTIDEPVAELENNIYRERVTEISAAIEGSDIRWQVFSVSNTARALQEQERNETYRLEKHHRQRDLADLTIRATATGTVIDCLKPTDLGRFLRQGDPVVTVVSGIWQVRAILEEDAMAASRPAIGDRVEIRTHAMPARSIKGVITRIAPTASRTIDAQALTHVGGGGIAIDPRTAQAQQPYFEITVDTERSPHSGSDGELRHGMVCQLRFSASAETIGTHVARRILRFVNLVSQR